MCKNHSKTGLKPENIVTVPVCSYMQTLKDWYTVIMWLFYPMIISSDIPLVVPPF